MEDSSASYTTYDDEEKESTKCPRNGAYAKGEPITRAPEGNRQSSLETTLEDAEGTRQGYVCFLESEDGDFIKTGFSNNPRRRLWEQKLAARLIGFVPGTKELCKMNNQELALVEDKPQQSLQPAMNIAGAKARWDAIREFVSQIMIEGEDYGVIPGTGRY